MLMPMLTPGTATATLTCATAGLPAHNSNDRRMGSDDLVELFIGQEYELARSSSVRWRTYAAELPLLAAEDQEQAADHDGAHAGPYRDIDCFLFLHGQLDRPEFD